MDPGVVLVVSIIIGTLPSPPALWRGAFSPVPSTTRQTLKTGGYDPGGIAQYSKQDAYVPILTPTSHPWLLTLETCDVALDKEHQALDEADSRQSCSTSLNFDSRDIPVFFVDFHPAVCHSAGPMRVPPLFEGSSNINQIIEQISFPSCSLASFWPQVLSSKSRQLTCPRSRRLHSLAGDQRSEGVARELPSTTSDSQQS
jgi:hypothetical protein